MKMKKIIKSLLAISLMAVVFTGCGNKADTAGSGSATTEKSSSEKVEVGIVLPTKDEPRWLQDKAKFEEIFEEKGYTSEILFSQGSSSTELQNVNTFITKGVKVLVICPQDGKAAAAAADAAKKAGIAVISYDRLITDTDAVDYYVTFDSKEVGKAQAQYLVDNATGTNNPLYLYTGASSDNNAFLFFEGAWEVLQPKVADGTFRIVNSSEAVALKDKATLTRDEQSKIIGQTTTNWDFNDAKKKAESNLTSAKAEDKGTVFILAPNDGTSRSIADVFAGDKEVTKYSITGQDAEKASIQYIIDGKQSMTVFKDVRILASDAIDMAVKLLEGGKPETTAVYDNGKKEVPSIQTKVVVVDKENVVSELIDTDYYKASDFKNLK